MTLPAANEFDPEHLVIEAIRDGDRYAFGELVRRNDRWVRGVIFGILGERDRVDDVAQLAWTSFWQRIGELRDPSRWRSWLYRLARNAAVDAGRAITRQRARMKDASTAHGSDRDALVRAAGGDTRGSDESMIDMEQRSELLRAIEGLPALYREPFVLRHLNGWSYREIAETMGMPVDSVETRLVRARRFLRDLLKTKLD